MKVHRRFSVFGSRLLFFALAPWLLVCIPLFPYMAFTFGKGAGSVLLSAMVSAVCLVGLLVAADSWRFIRLTIALLALVPVAYIWYFCHVYFVEHVPFTPSLRFSEATPFSALAGFMFWGIPAMIGVWSLSKKAKRIGAVEEKRRLQRSCGLNKREPNQSITAQRASRVADR